MAKPAEIKTPSDFVRLLAESRILSEEQMLFARQLETEVSSPQTLARRLMAKGLLTRWQAGQLLVGWNQLRLGHHRLCSQVGRSEYGRVFLAEHIQLQREVAIKTLSRRFTRDRAMVERFLEEARQVAALDHHNLVHLLDIDNDDGQYFMVMEYIIGRDLQRMVEGAGPLPCATAVEYLAQAAGGLAHAHEHGVFHRDVRPENLMVDEKETVKVLGLGVGYLAATGPFGQRSAHRGTVLRLADYRAPEQRITGTPGSAASDIYSLGMTAQYLLTGYSPLRAHEQDPASTDGSMTAATTHLLRLRPDTPESLAALVARAVAVDPEQRFASMLELQRALREWLMHEKDTACVTNVNLSPGQVRPTFIIPPPPPDNPATSQGDASRFAPAWGPLPLSSQRDTIQRLRHEESLRRGSSVRKRYVAGGAIATLVAISMTAAYFWWPTDGGTIALRRSVGTATGGANALPPILPPQRSASDPATAGSSTKAAESTNVVPTAASGAAEGTPSAAAADAGPSAMPTGAEQVPTPESTPATGASEPSEAAPTPDPAPATNSAAVPAVPTPGSAGAGTDNTASPPAPPVPVAPVKPFEHLPAAVDLPEAPHPTLPATSPLAPLQASVAAEVSLTLLGGEHAGVRGNKFVMQPEGGSDAGVWRIRLVDTRDEQSALPIAQLHLTGGQMTFGWEPNLPASQAEMLCNCVVRLRRADEVHDLRLRTPQTATPLAVDLTRMEMSERWPLRAPPEASWTRFEIVQLPAPFPATHTLDPATPVAADEQKVVVLFGEDPAEQVLLLELTPQLKGVFRLGRRAMFQVSPKLERFPLTAKKVESTTALVASIQLQKNLAAQQLRGALGQIPEGDPRRPQVTQSLQQAEAELAEASQATGRLTTLSELRQALSAGGVVHFRLFYLADDCEVELLRTLTSAE